MKARFIGALGVLAAGCGAPEADLAQSSAAVESSVIRIASSGDPATDTAQLEQAFQRATQSGQPTEIRLGAGTYVLGHTLRVEGFAGTLRGAGAATVVTNVTPFAVPDNIDVAGAPLPALFELIDSRFTFADLTLAVHGETTPWSAPSVGIQDWTVFTAAVFIVGSHADATFERVVVQGEDGPILGHNLVNGLFFEGGLGLSPNMPPGWISGRFAVRNSSIAGTVSGAPVTFADGAEIEIVGNHFANVMVGGEVDMIAHSRYAFLANDVAQQDLPFPAGAVSFFDIGASAVSDSSLLIAGNKLDAGVGVDFSAATFDGSVACAVVGNDIQASFVDVALAGQSCLVRP